MRTNYQADLDDLITGCRSENAKRSFSEAVACFRAGAYRACIVLTWTAVLFDYLGKLRELELSGNSEAATILSSFESARSRHDVALSQNLESKVLDDAASKFDLLTPIEKEDLERLRLDRHRCAHPSLLTLDDPYSPTAELARTHMRHAVEHLLSRPPVQGKEAHERIWADIESEYFPENLSDAVLRLSPRLSRARPSLVRGLVIECTKRLLKPDERIRSHLFLAIQAITELRHADVELLLREKLQGLADQVPDENLRRLVTYCAEVQLAWGALSATTQEKLRLFVERSDQVSVMSATATVPELWAVTAARLPSLSAQKIVEVAQKSRHTACLDEIVRRFETSSSFNDFKALREPLANADLRTVWSAAHQTRLLAALVGNGKLQEYGGFDHVAHALLAVMGTRAHAHTADWQRIHDKMVAKGWENAAEKVRQGVPGVTPPAVAAEPQPG